MIACSRIFDKKLPPSWRERGEVLLEAAIALPLVGVVVLGLGLQFAVSSDKLEHVKLATEVTLGPQEKSLDFDRATTEFKILSASTTPTATVFLDTIGNFWKSRVSSDTSFLLVLGYLHVNNTTGRVTNQTVVGRPSAYLGTGAVSCAGDSYPAQLASYAADQLRAMRTYSAVPTPTATPNSGGPSATPTPGGPAGGVAVGAKLYDVMIGGTRYQGYVEFMPFIFMLVCTEPVLGGVGGPTVSTFTLVPRRLVG